MQLLQIPKLEQPEVLRLKNVWKTYHGGHQAVKGISFTIRRGECLGLPHGREKTKGADEIPCYLASLAAMFLAFNTPFIFMEYCYFSESVRVFELLKFAEINGYY